MQEPTASIAYHVRSKPLSKIVPSVLEADITSFFAIEALGKDTDHTQVDEQADEQC